MRVRVLGSLEVLEGTTWSTLRAAKRGQVLGDSVLDSAKEVVQNHVLGLRQPYGPEFIAMNERAYGHRRGHIASDEE